jgi:hydroxypyruvate reductase
MTRERLRKDALELFHEGLAAVDPRKAVRRWVHVEEGTLRFGAGRPNAVTVDLTTCDEIVVVGAGKASVHMASAIEETLGDRLSRGVVAIPHGQSSGLVRIRTMPASHPIPDEAGVVAAREIARLVGAARENDLVVALFSGGGSALLPAPGGTITLEEKQRVTRSLLRSGAAIGEVNAVRKHLSFLKGGRLARSAFPARVVSLILSDVIGDDPGTIASGPTAPDPTTCADALAILRRYGCERELPAAAREHLGRPEAESPKPGDPVFARVHNLVVARNADALGAMARKAGMLGYAPVVMPEPVRGEARQAAEEYVRRCREIAALPRAGPLCVLSGGETTVTVRGSGRGGRNQEFALAAAQAMEGWEEVLLLSAGTDGIDGASEAAGAFVDGRTCSRARSQGLDPDLFLKENDSNSFFSALRDLLVTGATGTNVMDLQILLCA